MKTDIMKNITRNFNKIGFQLKKHSPEILVVAGVVGAVTSAVMACKATTKVNDILEDTKTKVDKVHEVLASDYNTPEEKYSVEDSKKDLTIIYTQTGFEFVKLYGPSVALGVLSITAILTSNNILRKRNLALAAAYTTIDRSFKEYRGRVVERFGKDLDHELKYNIKAKEIEETVTNEDGTETTETKTADVANPTKYSDYARFFDEACSGWTKDPELNLMFLKRQQSYANDLLQRRGYLFLNEVYDMLGIPRTKAGQVVGWVYDENCPVGDNYVDFGIYDTHREKCRDFVNGYERTILLDFNPDGNILDLM